MEVDYIKNRGTLMKVKVGELEDEMKVIKVCPTFVEYVLYVQDNTGEYALEYDLCLLACFLDIDIYVFSPRDDTNDDDLQNNRHSVDYYCKVSPYGRQNTQNYTDKYITVVRNGAHYEPAMSTAGGCVWLLSDHMKQLADEYMNQDTAVRVNELDTFCEIDALPRLSGQRQRAQKGDIIRMRDIFHMSPGEYFTDPILNGFFQILNYSYKNTMDFANTFFLDSARIKDYAQHYVSVHMRTRIENKSIFDLENYFVLNHIHSDHWGIIHVSLNEKSIICYDGYHMDQEQKYEEVKKCLNILARSLNVTEYIDYPWPNKVIDNQLYPKQNDGWNCGTLVAVYAYHITVNGYLPKATQNEEYLYLFRKFMFACFEETKNKGVPTLAALI